MPIATPNQTLASNELSQTRATVSVKSNGAVKPTVEVLEPTSESSSARVQTDSRSTNTDIPPVTAILATFISSATTSLLNPSLNAKLKECLLDFLAVTASGAHTAPSSEPILSAILSLTGSTLLAPPGNGNTTQSTMSSACSVLTQGKRFTPQYAALLNATFGHSLDFDDTHASGTLHAGVTVIAAALACSESLSPPPSSDKFLLALAVGYEITCRLGVALGFEAYARGFHNTSTAGIFGAVASIAVLKGLSQEVVENAFGLAGSKAAGSMQYLENGSWNKRLHPGFAAHDAFLCVALAEAGVLGARAIIEGKLGLLQAYTDRDRADVDWSRLVDGLGEKWEWMTTSLKPWPACRMTHGAIEMAGQLGEHSYERTQDVKARRVKKITVKMGKANMILVGQRTPNKVHPENVVDAQFSMYFQLANAWCYGAAMNVSAYSRLHDEKVKNLCDRIECVVDETCRSMSSRIDVEFEDGQVLRDECEYPLGEKEHPFVRGLVEKKFLGLMEPVYGASKAKEIMDCVDGIEDRGLADLMNLLA